MKISHPQPPEAITEKERNKVKYLTWNFIRLKFGKNSSIQSLLKVLNISSAKARVAWPDTSPSNSIGHNCQKICSWSRRSKTILENRKKVTFIYVVNNPIIYKFFKDFTNRKKKSNRVVVFSSKPFPTFLRYRDHWWNLLTIWKNKIFQIDIEEFSLYVWNFRLIVL